MPLSCPTHANAREGVASAPAPRGARGRRPGRPGMRHAWPGGNQLPAAHEEDGVVASARACSKTPEHFTHFIQSSNRPGGQRAPAAAGPWPHERRRTRTASSAIARLGLQGERTRTGASRSSVPGRPRSGREPRGMLRHPAAVCMGAPGVSQRCRSIQPDSRGKWGSNGVGAAHSASYERGTGPAAKPASPCPKATPCQLCGVGRLSGDNSNTHACPWAHGPQGTGGVAGWARCAGTLSPSENLRDLRKT